MNLLVVGEVSWVLAQVRVVQTFDVAVHAVSDDES